jgi:hypothetical protein
MLNPKCVRASRREFGSRDVIAIDNAFGCVLCAGALSLARKRCKFPILCVKLHADLKLESGDLFFAIQPVLVCDLAPVGCGRLMLLTCMRLCRVSYSRTTGAPKPRHRAKYNANSKLKVYALGSIKRPLFCVRSGGRSPSKKGESATARGDSVGSVRSPDAADKYPESIHVVDPSGVEKGGSGPVSSSSSKWLGSEELSFTVDRSFFPDYKPDALSSGESQKFSLPERFIAASDCF